MITEMDQKFQKALAELDGQKVFEWTDKKTVGRGYAYLDKIESLASEGGAGLVAKVQGTKAYFTHVFMDNDGRIDAECSCPAGYRCKHAVAVIMAALRKHKSACDIPEAREDFLDEALSEIEGAKARKSAKQAERDARVSATEKDEERHRAEVEARREKAFQERKSFFEVAISQGLHDEAARRFVTLPPKPGPLFHVSREDFLSDFERFVHKALSAKYPAVADKIMKAMQGNRWKQPYGGGKYP